MTLSTTPEIIADLKAGRMVVLVDEEDRENEGDLVFAADFVTADRINFLAKHGRGLICMPITAAHAERLRLPPMTPNNRSVHGTNFTISIEAAEGITTGISAADRARTVEVGVASRRAARGHRAAGTRVSADRATGRRARARRPHRSLLRLDAPRRPHIPRRCCARS